MTIDADRLYGLLPPIYRVRDGLIGSPLRGLVAALAEQAAIVERDIAALYDNAFIETCQEWVVPYIADLVGMSGLAPLRAETGYSARARVANALRYRRRKGTVTALEQLARDVTGLPAHAVEFFALLGWTQNVNHVRLGNTRSPDLRDARQLELVGGPFDPTARAADVRSIASGRGRYNIPNIGIFLWRLQSFWLDIPPASPLDNAPISRAPAAHPVADPSDGRFFFQPAEVSGPLFNRLPYNRDRSAEDLDHLVTEADVPGPLRRRPLYDELEARRQAIVDGALPTSLWFTADQPVLRVYVQSKPADAFVEIPPERIAIANLADPPMPRPEIWRRPPKTKNYQPTDPTKPPIPMPIDVAVDPVLGRLTFPAKIVPHDVRVGFAYGFSANMGGGPYDRRSLIKARLTRRVTWQIGVSKTAPKNIPEKFVASITQAIAEWTKQPPGTVGVIALLDSDIYQQNLVITVPQQSELHIIAAGWPAGINGYEIGYIEPIGRRPYLRGDVTISGKPTSTAAPTDPLGTVWLDGLWIAGKVTVTGLADDSLGLLGLSHVTLLPGNGGVAVTNTVPHTNSQLSVQIVRSLLGPVAIDGATPNLSIVESIVQASGASAVAAANAHASIQRCTLFGTVDVQQLEAGNSIFTDRVTSQRRQSGCVRFCYVPPGSSTPRRFRCQPDLAMSQVDKNQQAAVAARIGPSFTSRRFGDPAYAQLAATASPECMTGAEDESEMGAFSLLMQPQRDANLRAALDEYLRAGLNAGLFHVT
jgi:hypothetical protein